MGELLDLVLRAHGGLDRWGKFNKVTATIVSGVGLLPMKGLEVDPKPLEGTVTTHEESTVITPFGQSDWRMKFAPERVVIETASGMVVQERSNARASREQDFYFGAGFGTEDGRAPKVISGPTPGSLLGGPSGQSRITGSSERDRIKSGGGTNEITCNLNSPISYFEGRPLAQPLSR